MVGSAPTSRPAPGPPAAATAHSWVRVLRAASQGGAGAGTSREAYPGRAVRGAASGQQQPDDVQVVVVHGHVQGGQAALWGTGTAFTRGAAPWPGPRSQA